MTKKELVKIIREVVKRELKNVLSEGKMPVQQKQKTQYSKVPMLNEVLNETRNQSSEEEWPSIDANTLRAKFAGMQDSGNVAGHTDINNRPVDVSKLDPSVGKALTRDYSALVKKFK
tara:strand:+ start:888 stop:1238 length:351 start_codon:yes stop_codon:yes gene_type:complete